MTVWAVVSAYLGAANPFRRRRCLSVAGGRQVAMGAVVALVVYSILAIIGATLRDALDVSAPNARIAAGLVLMVVGLHAIVAPLPATQPSYGGRRGWLAPVLFPALLRPDLALVAFAADGSSGVLTVVIGVAIALTATFDWWLLVAVRSRKHGGIDHGSWERSLGASLGVLTVVASVRLVLDGVFAL